MQPHSVSGTLGSSCLHRKGRLGYQMGLEPLPAIVLKTAQNLLSKYTSYLLLSNKPLQNQGLKTTGIISFAHKYSIGQGLVGRLTRLHMASAGVVQYSTGGPIPKMAKSCVWQVGGWLSTRHSSGWELRVLLSLHVAWVSLQHAGWVQERAK